MKLLAWLIYIPLQLIWLPISVLAVLFVAYKQIAVSRRLGLSQTAIEIINGRFTGDLFGLRPDPASRRLAGVLPNTSTFGLILALLPIYIATKISGQPFLYPTHPDDAEAGIANLVFSRSPRFDQLIAAYAPKVDQFVILGAGLDTRAYGDLAQSDINIFELDQAQEQRAKRASLDRAGIASEHVAFIEVDFSDPNWLSALNSSHFDAAKPTLYLWEGVTLYLSDSEVAATLTALKANMARGSAILLDIYGARFARMAQKGAMAQTLEATGEQILFNLDFSAQADERLSTFAAENGFTATASYFLGSSHKHGPYVVVCALEPASM